MIGSSNGSCLRILRTWYYNWPIAGLAPTLGFNDPKQAVGGYAVLRNTARMLT
jgi:hypothetical protein